MQTRFFPHQMWCWTACKSFANFCPLFANVLPIVCHFRCQLFANLFYRYFGQCGTSTQVTSLARDYATWLDTLPLEVTRFPSSPLIITVPFFIFFLLIRFSLRAISSIDCTCTWFCIARLPGLHYHFTSEVPATKRQRQQSFAARHSPSADFRVWSLRVR